MVTIPAFELVKKFKDVDPETERLVLSRSRNRVTSEELFSIFEKGIAGEYGKFYKADPQTLLGWIDHYLSKKNSANNYLHTSLIPVDIKMSHRDYPLNMDDWRKEVNKCYKAFLNGISHKYFHPLCYDCMVMDDKISLNEYQKKLKERLTIKEATSFPSEYKNTAGDITEAKQMIMAEKFRQFKLESKTQVYQIK